MHRLQSELLNLIKTDDSISQFIEQSCIDGMWYWDLEQPDIEWMSERFWTTLGYDPAEKAHLASEWQEIIHPDDAQLALANAQKHFADPDHPYDQVVRYRHKNGHTVWIRCRGIAIRNSENQPTRMLGAHTDITALKQQEEKLHNSLLARDRFFARMSHEIRTPLFGMVGLAENLKMQVDDPHVMAKLDTMVACGQQLQAILNDILTLSKLNEGALLISKEGVLWSEILNYLASLYRPIAEHKGLRLSMSMQHENQFLDTDKLRLTQVLSNLLSNAVKYTSQGSISLSTSLDSEFMEIIISDTGRGIENVEAVMRPFEQQALDYDNAINGTGLGLDIVKTICEILQHDLNIESVLNKGTQVSVRVALATTATTSAAMPTNNALENIALNSLSFLVVDDIEVNREIIFAMLDGHCREVQFAENGQQAVDMVRNSEKAFDVVLLDLNMPIKDGFTAAREIRESANIEQPKILAFSADAFDETVKKCMQLGMDGHIAKPFTRDTLIFQIIELVNDIQAINKK